MPPYISVIVPCYHSQPYIRHCITSLIEQTYKNWEAIFVIDDSNFDNTVNILLEYSSDKRIRMTTFAGKTNPATARNYGIGLALGEFIAFLDADDWWEPTKLSRSMDTFYQHPERQWCAHWVTEYRNFCFIPTEVYPGHSMSIGGTGAVVCRRELLEKVREERGYIFDQRMNRNDDADLVLYIRHEPSVLIPAQLSYMRIRKDGLESSVSRYENYKIVMGMGRCNHAYGLMVFHTVLFLLQCIGLDPVKVKQKVMSHVQIPEL